MVSYVRVHSICTLELHIIYLLIFYSVWCFALAGVARTAKNQSQILCLGGRNCLPMNWILRRSQRIPRISPLPCTQQLGNLEQHQQHKVIPGTFEKCQHISSEAYVLKTTAICSPHSVADQQTCLWRAAHARRRAPI